MKTRETYNGSTAVCRAAGTTLRQLQWWDEQGFISPKHCGHKRLYTVEEERLICVVAQLKRKGITLHTIRKIAGRLKGICRDHECGWIITCGNVVKFSQSSAEVTTLVEGAKSAVCVVKLRNAPSATPSAMRDSAPHGGRPPIEKARTTAGLQVQS